MQKRVKRLSPWVAERIAAGEVIERPGSVVKELLENSLDAGATEIAVRLEDGGKSLIEVVDNGHGMHPEDLTLAIERHATSKLENLEDLEKIHTLGFRGEALPSVAAVSELTLLSRVRGGASTQAYELRASRFISDEQLSLSEQDKNLTGPKAVTYGQFVGSTHGTMIRAQGLFAQVPARLKFLKSQASEVSFVREWMERLALTHPSVGFKLFSDTRTVLNLRPVSEVDRVRQILCDGEDFPIVSAESDSVFDTSESEIRVRVHWVQGLSTPQTRKLVQVVNRRALRDRVLQQAVLNPLRQLFLPGQFPAIALFVDVHPSEIDVNVHPTKTEVRFLESRKLFSEIGRVVQKLVDREGAPMFVAGSSVSREAQGAWSAAQPDLEFRTSTSLSDSARFVGAHPGSHSFPQGISGLSSGITSSAPPTFERESDFNKALASENPLTAHPFVHAQYIGALFETYLLFQQGDDLVLIDQHAAHERIQYEKLKKRALTRENPPVQELLLPEVVRFQLEYRAELETRLPLLALIGFETEIFGEDSLLFRSIPAEWGSQQLRTRLKSLVDRLLESDVASASIGWDESLFEKIASEACHSAIRAGDRLSAYEAKDLVDQLFRCDHAWNCPHGRPSVVKMPRARFEEWFLRRV